LDGLLRHQLLELRGLFSKPFGIFRRAIEDGCGLEGLEHSFNSSRGGSRQQRLNILIAHRPEGAHSLKCLIEDRQYFRAFDRSWFHFPVD